MLKVAGGLRRPPAKFENPVIVLRGTTFICTLAFFLQLGLPSTLVCDENRAFPKLSSIGRIWKSRLFIFVDEKHFENVAFRVISLTEFSLLAYGVNTFFFHVYLGDELNNK